MMKTKKLLLLAFSSLLLASISVSCSKEDDTKIPKIQNQTPEEQWGKTLKGDGELLAAYPDFFVNYWAYSYRVDVHSDIALCIRGQYPYARYFSFSLYNDDNGDVSGGLDDVDIVPDNGSVNPFKETSNEANYFTVYIVPPTMAEEQIAKLPSPNIIRIKEGIEKATLCLRQYIGTDANGVKHEYGGVKLPAITSFDINTLEEVKTPDYIDSNVSKMKGLPSTLKSDEFREMPFFLSPISAYYPNYSTDYLYARTHLQKDSVLTFSFIPSGYPKSPEEYKDANARYWSICLGSASNTRSYYSVLDAEAVCADGKKASFIVVLKNNPKLEEVKAKVKALNDAGGYWNLIVWDSEKLDFEKKPIGNYIVFMYRNILPNKNWEHSIANMTPTNYYNGTTDPVEPIDKVVDKYKQIAHMALGDYGPLGVKDATEEFLNK